MQRLGTIGTIYKNLKIFVKIRDPQKIQESRICGLIRVSFWRILRENPNPAQKFVGLPALLDTGG